MQRIFQIAEKAVVLIIGICGRRVRNNIVVLANIVIFVLVVIPSEDHNKTRFGFLQSLGVAEIHWIVADISVAVQRLRIGRMHATQIGIGSGPASLVAGILPEPGVFGVGFSIMFVARKFMGKNISGQI